MRLMMRAVFALVCFGMGSVTATEVQLLADVAKFIEQREGCDHFRGETPEPPDKQRMKEVNREIRKLCAGTDKKLEQLKRKYAKNQAVVKRLSEFEDNIE